MSLEFVVVEAATSNIKPGIGTLRRHSHGKNLQILRTQS